MTWIDLLFILLFILLVALAVCNAVFILIEWFTLRRK